MPPVLVRLVSRNSDGSIRVRDYDTFDELNTGWEQIGTDDCSTDLDLRNCPYYRGLVGPIPDGKRIARYETPEVFEVLTKEWANTRVQRRRRRSSDVSRADAGPVKTSAAPVVYQGHLGMGSSVPNAMPGSF